MTDQGYQPPQQQYGNKSLIDQNYASDNDYFDAEQGGYEGEKDYQDVVQMGFIRKVYGILSIQLLATVAISVYMMYVDSVREYLLVETWPVFTAIGLSFVTLLPLICCYRKVYPVNMILLSVFTICESVMIGYICAIYYEYGYGQAILEAFSLTCALFVGLTAFTFQTKIRFTFYRAGGFGLLFIFLLWGALVLSWGAASYSGFALIGAAIMCLLIVWDTSRLLNQHGPDEYILCSINLYLDFINLFLYLLRFFGNR